MVSRRFMPPESGSTRSPARSDSWANSSSRSMRGLSCAAGQVEVPTVHVQVLADGQLQVEIVLLGHHAESGPDGGPVAIGVEAEDP